jgi:3-oxoacyl-[acyl-carrier protein] reductase
MRIARGPVDAARCFAFGGSTVHHRHGNTPALWAGLDDSLGLRPTRPLRAGLLDIRGPPDRELRACDCFRWPTPSPLTAYRSPFYIAPMPTTALITGATEGIGRATVFAVGRAGYRIGVCARTESKVRSLVEELKREGIEAAGAAADVGKPDQAERAVQELSRALGDIDVLINNAGILIAKPFEDLTMEDRDATMTTNVRSLFLMTRAVLPAMRRRRRGTVVNVASLAGRQGFVGGTAYTASKHAVLGFSRSLMLEARKDNVRVITICPGSVATGLLQNQPMLKADPNRILQPDDVAATILYAITLPDRALVSELDVRPTNP